MRCRKPVIFDTIKPMSKRKRKRALRRSNLAGMVVFGAGLVLVGLAALMSWPRPEAVASDSPSSASLTVPVEVDYQAPKLTLSDIDGRESSLTDYHGQVVLVNLWATWCPPCKAEMPTLKAYYEAHQADGFVTIAVNDGDPEEAVEAFAQEYGLTFPVWLDPTYQATDHAFKTSNLPSSFVIDREGNVRLRWVGEIDRAALEKYVTPLILE
jgi:cytochrome c biogenesis protein CcmG/thiol:disulfide interchange protein DsbE